MSISVWSRGLAMIVSLAGAGSLAAQANVTINDVAIGFEGDGGASVATFTVRVASTQSHGSFSLQYTTEPITAQEGSQCGGTADYARQSGSLSFSSSDSVKQVVITTCGDRLDEPTESFRVRLHSLAGSGVTIADNEGIATITDNDPAPSLRVTNVSTPEGNPGSTPTATFTVTLSAASGQTVAVNASTANGTATSNACNAGGDFVAANLPLTFAPGVTSQTVPVTVCGDGVFEGNEQYQLRLAGPSNATIATTAATGTITDDEAVPNLTINDVAVGEAALQTLQKNAVFTVTIAGPARQYPASVQYATAAGTATQGTACRVNLRLAGSTLIAGDFLARSGTLDFPPGTNTATISVPICVDFEKAEETETFTVRLSQPVKAAIGDGTGTGTIR